MKIMEKIGEKLGVVEVGVRCDQRVGAMILNGAVAKNSFC